MQTRITTKFDIGDLVEVQEGKYHRLIEITEIEVSIDAKGKSIEYFGVSPLDFASEKLIHVVPANANKVEGFKDCKAKIEWVLMNEFVQDPVEVSTKKVAKLRTVTGKFFVSYYLTNQEIHLISEKSGAYYAISSSDFLKIMTKEFNLK